MKKIISVLLVLVILFTLCVFQTSAEDDITDYPIIIVPGYSGSALKYVDENGTEEHIWGITPDMILGILENTIKNIGKEKPEDTVLQDAVGTDFIEWFRKLKILPDGTSLYPLQNYYETPEEGCSANVIKLHPDGQYRHEVEIQDKLAEYVGYENIFNFYNDFRYGAEHCANELDDYIQQVKAYTGKDKVNIYALSHGGQVTATYLALYGYKQDVDNAVLAIPAIGGAGIAYDILTANVNFREEDLLTFIQHGFMWEDDYDWLLKSEALGFVDDLLNDTLVPQAHRFLLYWGSLWDFIPTHLYEDAKKQLLDPVVAAGTIELSDRFHYEILPSMGEKLQECQDKYGMNITIVAGADIPVITGMSENSDAIITLNASTGATCAPYGERFADGYTQVNPCDGKNKVSPNMAYDLSTAYLPDDTWVVSGLFHGMVYKDEFTKELIINGVLNDKYENVYSSPDYPQFHATTNPSHTVHASFNNSVEGFADKNDTKFVIKNVCAEDSVKIVAVEFKGCDITVDVNKTDYIAPGESIELDFEGTLPEVGKKVITATLTYVSKGSVTPFGQRTFSFTLLNGENVEYSGKNEQINMPAGETDELNDIENPLVKAMAEFIKIFVDMFRYWFSTVFAK
ncbi:MAG: hypothetical protein IJ279_06190 [Clostridia bacterium]|nr:hypothetical protein [Clostridia bacterium]